MTMHHINIQEVSKILSSLCIADDDPMHFSLSPGSGSELSMSLWPKHRPL